MYTRLCELFAVDLRFDNVIAVTLFRMRKKAVYLLPVYVFITVMLVLYDRPEKYIVFFFNDGKNI